MKRSLCHAQDNGADQECAEEFHRRLKARAAIAGMSMSDYVLREVGKALDLQRHAHEPLLDRVWQLRQHVSAYDAVYVALAEALDAILVTCDGRLSRALGIARRVELLKAEG